MGLPSALMHSGPQRLPPNAGAPASLSQPRSAVQLWALTSRTAAITVAIAELDRCHALGVGAIRFDLFARRLAARRSRRLHPWHGVTSEAERLAPAVLQPRHRHP